MTSIDFGSFYLLQYSQWWQVISRYLLFINRDHSLWSHIIFCLIWCCISYCKLFKVEKFCGCETELCFAGKHYSWHNCMVVLRGHTVTIISQENFWVANQLQLATTVKLSTSNDLQYTVCMLYAVGNEQLIDLIDSTIIDVMIIIVMSIIHMIYKKSHQKLHYASHFDAKCNI